MRFPFFLSIFLHLFAFLLALYGLPGWDKNPFDVPPPIMVELVEIAKENKTTKIAPLPKEWPKEKSEKDPELKPVVKPKAVAKPSIIEDDEPEVTEKAVPLPEKKETDVLPKEELKKIKPEAPLKKPKLKSTKPIKKDEKKEDNNQFQSILRNLVGEEQPFAIEEDKESSDQPATPEESQISELADRMTISETDALRRQLEGCWNVPIGARDAEGLIVDVKLIVNPDKTVREAKIVDLSRYNTDPFFRAAADSAVRAVLSNECNPLILPDGKYNQWKVIIFRFNPQDMF